MARISLPSLCDFLRSPFAGKPLPEVKDNGFADVLAGIPAAMKKVIISTPKSQCNPTPTIVTAHNRERDMRRHERETCPGVVLIQVWIFPDSSLLSTMTGGPSNCPREIYGAHCRKHQCQGIRQGACRGHLQRAARRPHSCPDQEVRSITSTPI